MQGPDHETRYLTLADAIAIHEEIVQRTGGGFSPLRDERLLESALARPRMAAYYDQAHVVRQAALLAVAISQAQSFVDGNKRTAYACMEVFLYLNGFRFSGEPVEMAKQLEALASRPGNLADATDRFETWLRHRIS